MRAKRARASFFRPRAMVRRRWAIRRRSVRALARAAMRALQAARTAIHRHRLRRVDPRSKSSN